MSRQPQDQQQNQQSDQENHPQPQKKMKVLLALVDYDGCAGAATLAEISQKNGQLYHFLISKIKNYIKTGVQCKVVFAIGSARQAISIDQLNLKDNRNGSCVNLLPGLEAGLADALRNEQIADVDIHRFEFLTADLYSGLSDGQTLAWIANGQSNPDESFLHDEHKRTLLYTFMHKVIHQFSQFPNYDSTDCYFFDDRADILNKLNSFFGSDNLPRNSTLFLIQYVMHAIKWRSPPIQGQGAVILDKEMGMAVSNLVATHGFEVYIQGRSFPQAWRDALTLKTLMVFKPDMAVFQSLEPPQTIFLRHTIQKTMPEKIKTHEDHMKRSDAHPNILRGIKTNFHENGAVSTDIEFAKHTMLSRHNALDFTPELRVFFAKAAAKQVFSVAYYLQVVYDILPYTIAPNKILLQEDGCVKLGIIGLSRAYFDELISQGSERSQQHVQNYLTGRFTAPERRGNLDLFCAPAHQEKAVVWSLGANLLAILMGKTLWPKLPRESSLADYEADCHAFDAMVDRMNTNTNDGQLHALTHNDTPLQYLLTRCLQKDPTKRASLSEANTLIYLFGGLLDDAEKEQVVEHYKQITALRERLANKILQPKATLTRLMSALSDPWKMPTLINWPDKVRDLFETGRRSIERKCIEIQRSEMKVTFNKLIHKLENLREDSSNEKERADLIEKINELQNDLKKPAEDLEIWAQMEKKWQGLQTEFQDLYHQMTEVLNHSLSVRSNITDQNLETIQRYLKMSFDLYKDLRRAQSCRPGINKYLRTEINVEAQSTWCAPLLAVCFYKYNRNEAQTALLANSVFAQVRNDSGVSGEAQVATQQAEPAKNTPA